MVILKNSMKKVFVILIMILLSGCSKKELLDFQEISEMEYINENKSAISSVVVHKTTLGSNDCYSIDIEEAYQIINEIEIIKKSNISVTDDYLSIIFEFNDEIEKTISFEGKYLVNNNKNYEINNFPQIELMKENIIECRK